MRFASWSPSRHVGETRVYLEGSGCQRIIVSRLSVCVCVCVCGAGSGFAPPPSEHRSKAAAGDDGVPILPYISLSVWAAIVLLGRWAYKKPRVGGMSSSAHQRACSDLLRAIILNGVQSVSRATITIDIVAKWEIKHPRPQVVQRPAVISIGKDGSVDIKGFHAQVMAIASSIPAGW